MKEERYLAKNIFSTIFTSVEFLHMKIYGVRDIKCCLNIKMLHCILEDLINH